MKMSAGDQDLSRMQVKCCKSLVKKEGTEQKKQDKGLNKEVWNAEGNLGMLVYSIFQYDNYTTVHKMP